MLGAAAQDPSKGEDNEARKSSNGEEGVPPPIWYWNGGVVSRKTEVDDDVGFLGGVMMSEDVRKDAFSDGEGVGVVGIVSEGGEQEVGGGPSTVGCILGDAIGYLKETVRGKEGAPVGPWYWRVKKVREVGIGKAEIRSGLVADMARGFNTVAARDAVEDVVGAIR